jgi:hypothetical protein
MSAAGARVRRAVAGLGRPAGFGARAAGLSLRPVPGQVVRYAVHLDVIVDGRPVTVPAGIGVDQRAHLIAALFTPTRPGSST